MSISMDTLRGAARLGAQRLQGQDDGQLVVDARRPGLFNLAAKRDIGVANRATAAAAGGWSTRSAGPSTTGPEPR